MLIQFSISRQKKKSNTFLTDFRWILMAHSVHFKQMNVIRTIVLLYKELFRRERFNFSFRQKGNQAMHVPRDSHYAARNFIIANNSCGRQFDGDDAHRLDGSFFLPPYQNECITFDMKDNNRRARSNGAGCLASLYSYESRLHASCVRFK